MKNKILVLIILLMMFLFPLSVLGAIADTGWLSTSVIHSSVNWNSPENLFDSDDAYATTTSNSSNIKANGIDFPSLPEGATITGFEIRVEGMVHEDKDLIKAGIRDDGSEHQIVFDLPVEEGSVVVGSPTEKWGFTWSEADLTSDFYIYVISDNNGGLHSLDQIQVKVYYSPYLRPLVAGFEGNMPEYAIASTTAYIGDLFGSAGIWIYLFIGVPLGFFVIQSIVKLMKNRKTWIKK